MAEPTSVAEPDINADASPQRPQSLWDLFVSFTWLALQGFGGVQAVVQREMVERKRWLDKEEFLGDWATAQILPGANVVNLTLMIGGRYFGARGAAVALAGLLSAPAVIAVLLALTYTHFAAMPQVAGALRGIGAVTAGIVFAVGVRLIGGLRGSVLKVGLCAGLIVTSFILIAVVRVPLVVVLACLGSIAGVIAFKRLAA